MCLESERLEAERLESERREAERREAARLEAERLAAQGVSALAYVRLSALRKDGNRLVATLTHELTKQTQDIETDQVILETGTDPLAEVFFDLRENAANQGITDVDAMASWQAQPQQQAQGYTLHRLGDAVTSRSIHAAILEAYRLTVYL